MLRSTDGDNPWKKKDIIEDFPILFISQLQRLDTQSDNQVQLSKRQTQKRTGNLLEMVEDLSLEKKGKYFRLKRIEK